MKRIEVSACESSPSHPIQCGKPDAKVPALPATTRPAYEELLHFFNESRDLLCISGFDHRFKRLNPEWHPALGWTLGELRNRPILDFVHQDDRTATCAAMDKLSAGAALSTFENRYLCKDGSSRWLQWTASALPGRQEIYSVARDVTRKKWLEEEILNTLDRERERVGRELHDGLCQELAGISALAATLARKLAPTAEQESDDASEIRKLLGQSIRQARDLALGLVPQHLEGIGLPDALENFCKTASSSFKISCSFSCTARPPKLDAVQESHLYRIVQEAVNNAIAHGQAKRIEVCLSFSVGRGTLTVRDNGIGMGDPDCARRGVGLNTMSYRARLIGSTFDLSRNSPRGTVVTCVFPVTPVSNAKS